VVSHDAQCVSRIVVDRHQHLQHQLVARRRLVDWYGFPPSTERSPTDGSEGVDLLRVGSAFSFDRIDLHQSVSLQPVESCIDLANVEWPNPASRVLELGLQLIAVARAFIE
jgi:hypothetical protein